MIPGLIDRLVDGQLAYLSECATHPSVTLPSLKHIAASLQEGAEQLYQHVEKCSAGGVFGALYPKQWGITGLVRLETFGACFDDKIRGNINFFASHCKSRRTLQGYSLPSLYKKALDTYAPGDELKVIFLPREDRNLNKERKNPYARFDDGILWVDHPNPPESMHVPTGTKFDISTGNYLIGAPIPELPLWLDNSWFFNKHLDYAIKAYFDQEGEFWIIIQDMSSDGIEQKSLLMDGGSMVAISLPNQ